MSATAPDGLLNLPGNTITDGTKGATICAPAGGSDTPPTCPTTPVNMQVSGGWASIYNASGLTNGVGHQVQDWALGTTGQSMFNGSAVGSFNYSIEPTAGVGGGQTKYPFVYQEADFVMSGLSSSAIFVYNIGASYGTTPDFLITNPEPHTYLMISGALLLLLLKKRRNS
jgi:hypothetical protein